MTPTKTNQFPESHADVATLFKALSDPTSIAIVELLMRADSCISGDISEELSDSASVPERLEELKKSGIIKGNISETDTCYCLDPLVVARVRKNVNVIYETLIRQYGQRDCG